MTDLISTALSLETFTPRGVIRLTFDLMRESAGVIRLLVPWPAIRVASLEFRNKLEAFHLFEHVDAVVRIPADGVSLSSLIQQTQTLDLFRAVWANEGLGHYLTETAWQQSGPPRDLLRKETDELPDHALVPLHSGMGLAFGNRVLKKISLKSHPNEVRGILEQFVALCRDNSRRGYIEAVYESLGLVTRSLYPHLIPTIDRQLAEMDEDLVGYFWHGIGRAIYFAPTNALPDDSSSRALKMTSAEPLHEVGRRNALAGLAWAIALVNIRHPEVLESVLARHGKRLTGDDAFSNGVRSSILIWRDSTGESQSLTNFCLFEPNASDVVLRECWEQVIGGPCRDALDHYAALKKCHALGKVFRYGELSRLAWESGSHDSTTGGRSARQTAEKSRRPSEYVPV